MRITRIIERSVPLRGEVANALVDFSRHTVSLVAVVTDRMRNGKPVTGIAFNSIGRFAQGGILADRMIPRVLRADSESLLDDAGHIDPARVLYQALADEARRPATGPVRRRPWNWRAGISTPNSPTNPPTAPSPDTSVGTWVGTKQLQRFRYTPQAGTTTRQTAWTGSGPRCAAISTWAMTRSR